MRRHRAVLGIVVLAAIAGLAPSAASAATSCEFASGVMTVQMSAVHDDASFSVASNGEIVVSRAGTKVTCTGGTPTRVTTNVISIRNVPMQGGATTVELVEPSAFAPGASTADELGGDREIEVFVNFSGDLDSRLTLVGGPANEDIRAGTSGINPNARIAELAPDTDIFLVDVATAVTITGGNGFNVISATGGLGTGDPLTSPIVLVGGDGVDVLTGGNGHDSLYGGAGQDLLHGFGGNDALAPGSGDDDVDGGSGHDAVDYIANPTGVDVDLAIAGPQLGSGADTFAGIEDVYGTRERDVLRGDRGANQLIGFEGDDTITGRSGSDELSGGDGRDTIDARDGEPDMVTCGAGVDTVTTDRAGVDELNACDFALFPQPSNGGGASVAHDTVAPSFTSRPRFRRKRFRYALSEPATVTIVVRRRISGRFRRVKALRVSARRGANRTRFAPHRRGRYRAVLQAVDAAGNASAPTRVAFRVLSSHR
jgi:Ca2+-binding RTX toxin-like protein